MSYIVIGDIHGCAEQLEALLDRCSNLNNRRFVFLGDYLDIGPQSKKVLELLIQFRQRYQDSVFLCGNHELGFRDYLAGGDFCRFARCGGIATIRSYAGVVTADVRECFARSIPRTHLAFLADLGVFLETPDVLFSHCGFDPLQPDDRSLESMAGTSHQALLHAPPDIGKLTVVGHYFQKSGVPVVRRGVVCIDTGCGIIGGPLTALLLPELEFMQVSADRTISPIKALA